MTDIKRVGDTGIHTIEGNIAGDVAAQYSREREKQRQEYESLKNKIKNENKAVVGKITEKFSSAIDTAEQDFRKKTIGLVSAEEFRKASREAGNAQKVFEENQLLEKQKQLQKEIDDQALKSKERQNKRKKAMATLSFAGEEENEEDEEFQMPMKKSLKNPNVDTSFLPDPRKEKELEVKKEELKKEWLEKQEQIKKEALEVTYSYWDGSGHRNVIEVKKGTTIGQFLDAVRKQICKEFVELRSSTSDDLMYIKEDLIIPHHISFYDLIITKARGKSGPLFHFDVHDDIRLKSDTRIEKDESHPGKVVERRWYERNKHIFPASRWEIYDPSVSRENQQYSIKS